MIELMEQIDLLYAQYMSMNKKTKESKELKTQINKLMSDAERLAGRKLYNKL
jgi:hypothetical protein